MVMAQGYTQEEVATILADVRGSTLIDEKTKNLLHYAEKLTLTPSKMSESDIHALRAAGCTDEEIFEATMVAATFNMLDRLADALGVEVEHLQKKVSQQQRGGPATTHP